MLHDLEVVIHWKDYMENQRSYSSQTVDSYLSDVKDFIKFISDYYSEAPSLQLLSSVDIRLIRSWLSSRHQKKYSSASIARALSSVKNFYKYLEKKHNINCHAIFLVHTPKKKKNLPKALSQEEAKISLQNIVMFGDEKWLHVRNKSLITLIYATGMRISEALSITKRHLDNDEFIKITGKGGKERIIPWIKEAKLLVEQYVALSPYVVEDDEPIFRGKRGAPLQRAVFNKELIKLRRTLGLPEFLSSHAFRHSFATHMLESGANLRSIQELLGHASLSTTQRYTKINKTHLESVYNKAHPESN